MNTEELHVHLNGDEAMCFGAAFIRYFAVVDRLSEREKQLRVEVLIVTAEDLGVKPRQASVECVMELLHRRQEGH